MPAARAEWLRQPERGSGRLLRAYARVSRRLGRRASRPLLHAITAWYLAFAPRARAASRDYLRRALGREPRLADVHRHFACFATTIHDRVFLADGDLAPFAIETRGLELLSEAAATGRGALLIGAHFGSFEVVNAVGQVQGGVRVAMAMFEENARKMRAMFDALRPKLDAEVIALGRIDAMLRIRDRLDAGVFVGMLGDRTPGEEPAIAVPLLGEPARLPTGPLRAAAMLRRPVIFMAGVHLGGNRYRVVFEPLADFSGVAPADRDGAIADALARYADLLTRLCREHPWNWFNFFDVWRR